MHHIISTSLFLVSLTSTSVLAADYQFHVYGLTAACPSNRDCNYSFNVLGNETDAYPAFDAYCTARTMPRDSTYRPCDLKSGAVQGVEAWFSLGTDPQTPSQNYRETALRK
ncbi:uncharacterized protein MYCFIDRAFT_79602 [Pseudocercospora fijiensis CIRAD86]|uniref:Uncharacterized protein n=1 Tax=Pseudocercospora fijiensis (strain CIRAD86) TaxID=383855 RepID=M3A3W1_PSEFD|nr:uncharacterized protein MYCFIDRAFT_79602 [Pseudocercospora fijiensis CIRAD86]EME79296.1 hypothetical protein MYCFIDRAFT_79602 [Pseudocercospora fijiensis CIRAD86]